MGGEQAASVLTDVKKAALAKQGVHWSAEEEAAFREPLVDKYTREAQPVYASRPARGTMASSTRRRHATCSASHFRLPSMPRYRKHASACSACEEADMTALLSSLDARGVATLTLNRPEVHNAFDDALIAQLNQEIDRFSRHPDVRLLVLNASGKSFSAGADLGWMKRMASYSQEANLADAAELERLMRSLYEFPRPTLAVVQGAAYGGAVGLVSCCDIAIASSSASFALSEAKLGLAPAVISPYVVAAIGARQASRYFLTAERFDAARAATLGLVHEVVTPEALGAQVDALINTLLANGPVA